MGHMDSVREAEKFPGYWQCGNQQFCLLSLLSCLVSVGMKQLRECSVLWQAAYEVLSLTDKQMKIGFFHALAFSKCISASVCTSLYQNHSKSSLSQWKVWPFTTLFARNPQTHCWLCQHSLATVRLWLSLRRFKAQRILSLEVSKIHFRGNGRLNGSISRFFQQGCVIGSTMVFDMFRCLLAFQKRNMSTEMTQIGSSILPMPGFRPGYQVRPS